MGFGMGMCCCTVCAPVDVDFALNGIDFYTKSVSIWDSEHSPYQPFYGNDSVTVTLSGFGGPNAGSLNAAHAITDGSGDITRASPRGTLTGSVTAGASGAVAFTLYRQREGGNEHDTVTVTLDGSNQAVYRRTEGGTTWSLFSQTPGNPHATGTVTLSMP